MRPSPGAPPACAVASAALAIAIALWQAPSPARADDNNRPASVIREKRQERVWTWVAIGIGSAALAGAVVTGSLAIILDNEIWSQCPNRHCYSYSYRGDFEDDVDRLRSLGLSADILLGVAAAGLASGIALYFLEPGKGALQRKPVAVYSTAYRGGAGLALVGSF